MVASDHNLLLITGSRGSGDGLNRGVRAAGEYNRIMRITTHHSLSLDGFSATPDGWPAITTVTEFKPKESHGIPEHVAATRAVAMGRTTFLPALTNAWWPWPGRRVYVLSSRPLPSGTPGHVVHVPDGVDALIDRLRTDDIGGDVDLLGGPSLIRAMWQRDAIDELGLIVLPIMFGGGLRLFPLDEHPVTTRLRLAAHRIHPDGSAELRYERA